MDRDDALLEVDERLSALSLAAAALEPICAVIALFRSAATRSGRTTFPRRRRQFCATEHHASASGRSESRDRIVASNSLPTSSGNRYCTSGITGSTNGMSRVSGSDLRFRESGRLHTGRATSGRTAIAGNGTASRSVYISHFAGMPSHWYV